MRPKKFFTYALIFSLKTLFAQSYVLNGYVYEQKDSTVLVGVNVIIEELKIGTATDSYGKFEFKNLKEGTYTLKFSHIGHKTIVKKVQIPSQQSIKIYLEEGIINLKEISVTGNPFSLDPKELTQSTISISNLELEIKRNANIAQILNFHPGISMRSNGLATSRPIIRGFNNSRILILEDGLRMGDLSNTSDDHGISEDGSTPQKIEVLRGPSSLLYGSNAIGGVVNIITEDIPSYIPDNVDGEINIQNSTVNNEYNINSRINFGAKNLVITANHFTRKSKDYKDGNGNVVLNSNQFTNGYQFGFSFIPSFLRLGISFKNYINNYGIPINFDEEPVKINMYKKEIKFLFESDDVKYLFNKFSLKLGYQNYGHKEIIEPTEEIGSKFGLNTLNIDFSLNHKKLFESNNGILGVSFQKQNYSPAGEESLTPEASNYFFAFYIYEQLKLSKYTMQFGIRTENNLIKINEAHISNEYLLPQEKKYFTISGAFGINYNLSNQLTLFTNIAKAFRAPTIEELASYAIHEATSSFDIGNRKLFYESNLGFDLGARLNFENLFLELTSYYNSVENFIYRKPLNIYYNPMDENKFNNTNGYPVFIYSQGNALIYGFELETKYEINRNLYLSFMTDYTRGILKDINDNLPQIPPLRFLLETRYFTDNFWIGYRWKVTATQNFVAENENRTKGYGIIDLYLGLRIKTGKYFNMILISGENILNQAYKDHLSAIKDFAYMPGRNFRIGYKFLF